MKKTRLLTLSVATGLFVASFGAAAQQQTTTGTASQNQQGKMQQGAMQEGAMQQGTMQEGTMQDGAQQTTSGQSQTQARQGQTSDFPKGEMKGMEPMVPAGPAIAPGIVPMVALERLQGVETVTLDTPQGPVVVISWPVSGNVSSSEYNVNFSAMDTNKDGYISREETNAMAGRSKAARQLSQNFDKGDANRDDRLSMSEVIDWIY